MNWIAENWDSILLVITGLISVASVIVKLTPNETDNQILEKIVKFFEKLGLNNKPINS